MAVASRPPWVVTVREEDGVFGLCQFTLLDPTWPLLPEAPPTERVHGDRGATAAVLWRHTLEASPSVVQKINSNDMTISESVGEMVHDKTLPTSIGRTYDHVFWNNCVSLLGKRGVVQKNRKDHLLLFSSLETVKTFKARALSGGELEFVWVDDTGREWPRTKRVYTTVSLALLVLEIGTLRWPPDDPRMGSVLRLRCRLLVDGTPVTNRECTVVELMALRRNVLVSTPVTRRDFRGNLTRTMAPATQMVTPTCFRVMLLRPAWMLLVSTDDERRGAYERVQPFSNPAAHAEEATIIQDKMDVMNYAAYKDFASLQDACQYICHTKETQSLDCIVASMIDKVWYAQLDGTGDRDAAKEAKGIVPMMLVHCQDVTVALEGVRMVQLEADTSRELLHAVAEAGDTAVDDDAPYVAVAAPGSLPSVLQHPELVKSMTEVVSEARCVEMDCVLARLVPIQVEIHAIEDWKSFTSYETKKKERTFYAIEDVVRVRVINPPIKKENLLSAININENAFRASVYVNSIPRTLETACDLRSIVNVRTYDATDISEIWQNFSERYEVDTKYTTHRVASYVNAGAGVDEWRCVYRGTAYVPPIAAAETIEQGISRVLASQRVLYGESLLVWLERTARRVLELSPGSLQMNWAPSVLLESLTRFSGFVVAHVWQTDYRDARATAGPASCLIVKWKEPAQREDTSDNYREYETAGRAFLEALRARWRDVQRMASASTAAGAHILQSGNLRQCMDWTRAREREVYLLPRDGYDPALLYIRPAFHKRASGLDARVFDETAKPTTVEPFETDEWSFAAGGTLAHSMLGDHPSNMLAYRLAAVQWAEHARELSALDILRKGTEEAIAEKVLGFFRAMQTLDAHGGPINANVKRAIAEELANRVMHSREKLVVLATVPGPDLPHITSQHLLPTAVDVFKANTTGTGYVLHLLHKTRRPTDHSDYYCVLTYGGTNVVADAFLPAPDKNYRAILHSVRLPRTSIFYTMAWWLTLHCECLARTVTATDRILAPFADTPEHKRTRILSAYWKWRELALMELNAQQNTAFDPYSCTTIAPRDIQADGLPDRYLCALGRTLRDLFVGDEPWKEDLRTHVYSNTSSFSLGSSASLEHPSPYLWLHSFVAAYGVDVCVHLTTTASTTWSSRGLGDPSTTTIGVIKHGTPSYGVPLMHLELRMGTVARPMVALSGISSARAGLSMAMEGESNGRVLLDARGNPSSSVGASEARYWHDAVFSSDATFMGASFGAEKREERLRVIGSYRRGRMVYGPAAPPKLWT